MGGETAENALLARVRNARTPQISPPGQISIARRHRSHLCAQSVRQHLNAQLARHRAARHRRRRRQKRHMCVQHASAIPTAGWSMLTVVRLATVMSTQINTNQNFGRDVLAGTNYPAPSSAAVNCTGLEEALEHDRAENRKLVEISAGLASALVTQETDDFVPRQRKILVVSHDKA